jgi:hypothetical protein
VDINDVIALDLPYGTYAQNQAFYRIGFVNALTHLLGDDYCTVYVTNFQTSSSGGTLLFFDVILQGFDTDVVAAHTRLANLFTSTELGSPATPALVDALAANGVPAAGAYYLDQLASTPSAYVDPAPAPFEGAKVGTWQHSDSGEVVAVDVPYEAYAINEQFYKEAFTAGMAAALNLPSLSVWVNDFQQSAAGNVLIYFDVALSATSSTAISNTFAEVMGLFTDCHPSTGDRIGCPAQPAPCTALPCTSGLVSRLKEFGLPITNAYYNQQNLGG